MASFAAALRKIEAQRSLMEEQVERWAGINSGSRNRVGIENLAAALSEERGTLEEVVEPYLIQQGYLMRTPRGRTATSAAWRRLGLTAPAPADLFPEPPGPSARSGPQDE